MKKAMIGTLFLLVTALVPLSVKAQTGVSVGVNVALPPPIVFSGPPQVVVIPESNVYVVPDVEADIFFSQGWWWRPWEGRWYRSRFHERGWGFYRAAPPPFYRNVPPGWRNDYRPALERTRMESRARSARRDGAQLAGLGTGQALATAQRVGCSGHGATARRAPGKSSTNGARAGKAHANAWPAASCPGPTATRDAG
jgi:hypothetical protein